MLLRTCIICNLHFTDDTALVATLFKDTQELVDHYSNADKAVIKKMEGVHQQTFLPKQIRGPKQNHQFPNSPIKIERKNLKYFKFFTYWSSRVNSSSSFNAKIVNWIAKATNTFGKLHHCLWYKKCLNLGTKIQVYKDVIHTMLLYGSAKWTSYQSHINQLDIFHKECLQTICGWKRKYKC